MYILTVNSTVKLNNACRRRFHPLTTDERMCTRPVIAEVPPRRRTRYRVLFGSSTILRRQLPSPPIAERRGGRHPRGSGATRGGQHEAQEAENAGTGSG